MIQHRLINITDDLQETKASYLIQGKKCVRCVIKREHENKVWVVEEYDDRQKSSLDRLADELVDVGQKIVINRKKLKEKLPLLNQGGKISGRFTN